MPSIIQGYEYDIFISYRQKDNHSDQWVTKFIQALKEEIDATFKEDISIYFDENPHDGLHEHHEVDDSLREKLKCLIFIPIVSQTYCDPKAFAWEHEFKVFIAQASGDEFGLKTKLSGGNVASRVLPVMIHDLESEDQQLFESEVGGVMRSIDFIYKDTGVNRPLSSDDSKDENLNKTRYRDQVNKVANAIKGVLRGLQNPTLHKDSPTMFKPQSIIENTQKSIVVLPFVNMSNDPEQEYFSDGLTEEIISNFSKVSSLKVISRTSSNHYRNTNKLLKEIANELAVDYVLEGSVRRQGKELRITAQLIDAANDAHLWTDNYEGTIDDVFEIQEKVAGEMVNALDLNLTAFEGKELAKQETKNIEAFDFYLKGNFALWQFSIESNDKAIKYFEQAIEIDPEFGKPYAGIGMCYNAAAWFESMNRNEALSKANEWLKKAIDIDNQLAEAYNYLAYNNMLNWNWVEAEEQIKRAIELKSSYADAHLYYGWLLGSQARIDESEVEFQIALELDPQSVIIQTNKSFPYYWKKDFGQAITQVKRAIDMEPTNPIPYWFLGVSSTQDGNFEAAIDAFQNAIKFSGGLPYYKAWLAHAYALSARKSEALHILSELERISAEKGTLSYQLALIHLGLGNHEKALNYLEKAFAERGSYIFYLKVEPYLDPLRSHPKFERMIKEMNLL